MTVSANTEHHGKSLQRLRRDCGLTQARLARLAGVGYHTVSRWESKPKFQRHSKALNRILAVLEPLHRYRPGQTRARGHGVLQARWELMRAARAKELDRFKAIERRNAARRRVRCGAKTRKGTPCRLKSEPGRQRCKYHGGKSTGPKTTEGRARIAEVQRRRWAIFRSMKDLQN